MYRAIQSELYRKSLDNPYIEHISETHRNCITDRAWLAFCRRFHSQWPRIGLPRHCRQPPPLSRICRAGGELQGDDGATPAHQRPRLNLPRADT